MSEPRKNHLSIDGGQIKEDDNVSSYKPIPEADTEFRTKPTLSKSKEKISDEAEEKLLDKETEAKIITRVDMADAKYVVGDHRNGDAKIELDANKRQFSGLTKEELMKYADDPFWVRLRWFMFVLFWALWLCMLAGAIAIIVRAPKCNPPPPKTWFEKGPLIDASAIDSYELIEEELPAFERAGVKGVFTGLSQTYEVLDDPGLLERFKQFVAKAKEYGVKVIVDLTPNFVPASHAWFQQSVNRSEPYDKYFTWAAGSGFTEEGTRKPPNNWASTLNTSAWTWNEERKEFYLHQYDAETPDLNFHNPRVVEEFDKVLRKWVQAGANGVRLHKVRQLLVNSSLPEEAPAVGRGSSPAADHLSYSYWRHKHTSDQEGLDGLLKRWDALLQGLTEGDSVFTVAEEGDRPELFLLARSSPAVLRPRSAAPLVLRATHTAPQAFVADLKTRLPYWPAVQLAVESGDADAEAELAELALLLPAAPVLRPHQILAEGNDTNPNEKLSHLVSLREDASIQHGYYNVSAVPADGVPGPLVACARWKQGHTGYVAVFNPWESEARANLTVQSLPDTLTVHHVTRAVRAHTNYTSNQAVPRADVAVPPKGTVVLSYVPVTAVEE